jgi:transcriptional regulator with XRE-family HTH domain
MKDHESTARSRELGEELRRVRELAGLSATHLARKLGWSQSRISRLETGKRGASELDVAVFLAVCQVTGKELERLVGLCKEVYTQTWLQSHGELIPDQLRTLAMHEATATKITSYEPLVIEGLVQTEDYARAVFRCTGLVSRDLAEARVRARIARQNLIHRRPAPAVCFYIGEQALHATAGNARVMNEQLLHLSLVSGRPQCTIRVVPAEAGLRGAALGGQFRLMEFEDHGPVVFVDRQTSSLFLEDEQDVAAYRAILNRLAEITLNEGQSRELLVRLANDHDVLEDEYEFP